MSALRLGNDPARLAEVVTISMRLEQFRSAAGLTSKFAFLKPSVRRLAPAPVSPRKKAVTPPHSALVLAGIPGTGRFLF
jgi:hypothetical protein